MLLEALVFVRAHLVVPYIGLTSTISVDPGAYFEEIANRRQFMLRSKDFKSQYSNFRQVFNLFP